MTLLSRGIAAICGAVCIFTCVAVLTIGAVPVHAQSLPTPSTEPVSLAPADIQKTVDIEGSDEDFNVPPVNDPLEPLNRVTLEFNQQLDDWLIRPAAKGYDTAVPPPVRLIIGNVFGNVGDLWSATNNLLQGKPRDAGSDALRFAINTTFGLVGSPILLQTSAYPSTRKILGRRSGAGGYRRAHTWSCHCLGQARCAMWWGPLPAIFRPIRFGRCPTLGPEMRSRPPDSSMPGPGS